MPICPPRFLGYGPTSIFKGEPLSSKPADRTTCALRQPYPLQL